MGFHKRKKSSRMRGSGSHGYGAKKKHRGSGHRGGVGRAGTGKRADSKKPSIWKERYFGKQGFKRKNAIQIRAINIDDINKKLERFTEGVKQTKDGWEIDLGQLGYQKLLGRGKPVGVYFIKVDYASRKAIEKIEAKGGKVNVSTNFDRGAVEEPKQKTEETEEQQEPKEKKEPKKSEGKG